MITYWYGIIRDQFGKIRFKRVSTAKIPTQEQFLQLLKYNNNSGDVVLELDCGNHMTGEEFTKYVKFYYQTDKKVTLSDIENLIQNK